MAMNIDDAIRHVGAEAVREIVRSGHAHDAGHVLSFRGRATSAWLRGQPVTQDACMVLAEAREADIWQATKSPERLEREFLEDGSGRAMNELLRRGLPLPQAYDLLPARL